MRTFHLVSLLVVAVVAQGCVSARADLASEVEQVEEDALSVAKYAGRYTSAYFDEASMKYVFEELRIDGEHGFVYEQFKTSARDEKQARENIARVAGDEGARVKAFSDESEDVSAFQNSGRWTAVSLSPRKIRLSTEQSSANSVLPPSRTIKFREAEASSAGFFADSNAEATSVICIWGCTKPP